MNDYSQDDECVHGMPDASQCSLCQEQLRRRQRRTPLPGSRSLPEGIEAAYSGTCPHCGDNIARGDRIVRAKGGYLHVGCI